MTRRVCALSGGRLVEEVLVKARLARWILWCFGWRCVGQRPSEHRYVLACAPHTSNWDLVVLLLVTMACGVRLSWIGKHTLFEGPFGPVMRWLGGVSVDRSRAERAVEDLAARFRTADQLVIAICPEGTRSRAGYWKSGFYRIAQAAGVPIVLGFVNYERRTAGFAVTLYPTGDVSDDMDMIRSALMTRASAKYPGGFGPVRLRDEEGVVSKPAA